MLTQCTGCYKNLTVKDEALGKKARCPHCQSVFVAEPYVEPEIIEAEPEPPAVDVEIEESAGNSEGANWSFGKPAHVGGIKPRPPMDLATRHVKAMAAMRSAANWMLVAFLLTLLEYFLNVSATAYLWYLRIQNVHRHQRVDDFTESLVGACCGVLVFGAARLFVGLAVPKLYRAGSRSVIITGIVFDLLLMFEYLISLVPCIFVLYGLYFDAGPALRFLLDRDGRIGVVAVTIGIWSQFVVIVALVGLFAAIRGIRALRHEDVKNYYYQLRSRDMKRRSALEDED